MWLRLPYPTNNKIGSRAALKGSVSWDFQPPVFFMIQTHQGPDKLAKLFLNSVSISSRYSITKLSLRGVQHTAVCNANIHRGDHLNGEHHTAETISTVRNIPRNQNRNLHLSLVAFKETIRGNPFRGGHIYSIMKEKIWRTEIHHGHNFVMENIDII